MKIFISGQKWFGEAVFRMIRKEHPGCEIIGVSAPVNFEKPDRLYDTARRFEIPIIPAGTLTADTLPEGVDIGIAAHSHDFIGKNTRYKTSVGWIGYHPSLLPLHRGRDSVKWAIKMRERVTGGSVYWLNSTVDGGDIAAQKHVFIRPGDTAEELWRRDLAPLGVRLLSAVLKDLTEGTVVRIPQDPKLATWEPALDAPALRRPDLLMLGDGRPEKKNGRLKIVTDYQLL